MGDLPEQDMAVQCDEEWCGQHGREDTESRQHELDRQAILEAVITRRAGRRQQHPLRELPAYIAASTQARPMAVVSGIATTARHVSAQARTAVPMIGGLSSAMEVPTPSATEVDHMMPT